MKAETGANKDWWRKLWKWKGPERIKTFLWVLANNKLLTNVARVQRGMTESSLCTRCGQTAETNLHAIRDCPAVKGVWLKLVSPSRRLEFFHGSLDNWLEVNLTSRSACNGKEPWTLTFGIACWVLWFSRNMAIFQPEKPSTDAVMEVHRRVQEVLQCWDSLQRAGVVRNQVSAEIGCWQAPAQGWFKLNVDGACVAGGQNTACGGVLRDHVGTWVSGFAFHASLGSTLTTELLAILLGIQEARYVGLKQLVVESDCEVALNLLEFGCPRNHPCYPLVSRIVETLDTSWRVTFKHVYRENNRVADKLARMALQTGVSRRQMGDPPAECMELYRADMENMSVG